MARNGAGWGRAIALIALPGLLLAGCASPGGSESDLAPGTGTYRVGEPYEIKGVWYYPAIDYNYDRTGIASWYGEEFEGRLTANGEIFDLNALTAAHTTLPLPSIVQVTNLENGRSLQLRVNDRGPFLDGRLIDVSRRAAQLLGFESQGTTRVRVTILKDESIAAAEEAMRSAPPMVAAIPGSTPWPRAERSYAAAAEPQRSTRVMRTIAPAAPATQLAMIQSRSHRPLSIRTAMISAETPPAGQAMISASQPPSSRYMRTARYRFSLISPAEAAELPNRRAAQAHLAQGTSVSGPVAKLPTLTGRIASASKGPSGRIFVQAGAFAQRENAERAERRLSHWGSVQVIPVSVKGVSMYRIRIGPFANQAEAKALLARIVNGGYPVAHFVSD